MDRAAHTPGPWLALCDTDGSALYFPSEREAREWVAHCDLVTDGNVTWRTMPYTVAAAAPDLLAALRDVVAIYGDFAPGQPFEEPEGSPIATARAALAKAEGA